MGVIPSIKNIFTKIKKKKSYFRIKNFYQGILKATYKDTFLIYKVKKSGINRKIVDLKCKFKKAISSFKMTKQNVSNE